MIAIIDYEIGNLGSVQKAVQRVGGQAVITAEPDEIDRAEKVILPGVAAFGDAMTELRRKGLIDPIRRAIDAGKPYLGFCLGLQLLFETSTEDGRHEGLGILPGRVERFDLADVQADPPLRVPHMGWNQLRKTADCPLLEGIDDGDYVYFAHSYHVVPDDDGIVVTTTEYGRPFVSSVWRDPIFATQFHPEKSQAVGMQLLANFVKR